MEHLTPETLAAMAGKLEGFLVGAPEGHPLAETLREASAMLQQVGSTLADLESRLADAIAAVDMLRAQAPAHETMAATDDADGAQAEWITDDELEQLIATKVAATLATMLPALRAELAAPVANPEYAGIQPSDTVASEPAVNESVMTEPVASEPMPVTSALPEPAPAPAAPAAPAPAMPSAPTGGGGSTDGPVIERAPLSPFAAPTTPQASAPKGSSEHVGFAPRAQSYVGPFAEKSSTGHEATSGDEGGLLSDLLHGGVTLAPPGPLVPPAEPASHEPQSLTHPVSPARPEDPAAMARLAHGEEPQPRPMDDLREPVAGNEPILPPWAQPE